MAMPSSAAGVTLPDLKRSWQYTGRSLRISKRHCGLLLAHRTSDRCALRIVPRRVSPTAGRSTLLCRATHSAALLSGIAALLENANFFPQLLQIGRKSSVINSFRLSFNATLPCSYSFSIGGLGKVTPSAYAWLRGDRHSTLLRSSALLDILGIHSAWNALKSRSRHRCARASLASTLKRCIPGIEANYAIATGVRCRIQNREPLSFGDNGNAGNKKAAHRLDAN